MRKNNDNGIVFLDFETSGMSPEQGDRAIEIGAVLIKDGGIADRFQSLMNPGMRINSFIEDFTGISNEMLLEAPAAEEVMGQFFEFIADYPLVAHNAAFDQRFLDAELGRISKERDQNFGCSLLISRRVYPDAPDHKLETLIRYKGLSVGTFHRALADSEMTARLWLQMVADLQETYGLKEVPFELMQQLEKLKKANVINYLKKRSEAEGDSQVFLF